MRRVGAADFFTAEARKSVAAAVAEVESCTCAEIVVVVRHRSASWREVDLSVGAITAFAMLLLVLFHPKPVPLIGIPIDVALAFLGGFVMSAGLPALKRALLLKAKVTEQARARAREAFVDQGVSRTHRRTGVLVYVSIFERRVELVADVGVPSDALKEPSRALAAAFAHGADFDAFVGALRTLRPALERPLPRAPDDVNELPDEPVVS